MTSEDVFKTRFGISIIENLTNHLVHEPGPQNFKICTTWSQQFLWCFFNLLYASTLHLARIYDCLDRW